MFGRPDGPGLRLPGSVGIGDMAAYYPRLYAYVTRHHPRPSRAGRLRERPGTIGTEADRQARGLRWGRPHRVLTDLCVFEFGPGRPGRWWRPCTKAESLEEVAAATGFAVTLAPEAGTTPAPTADELTTLSAVDPDGLRYLEILGARDRRQALRALLS